MNISLAQPSRLCLMLLRLNATKYFCRQNTTRPRKQAATYLTTFVNVEPNVSYFPGATCKV